MRVAVIGANGQLGSDVAAVLEKRHEVIRLTHQEIEVTDAEQVRQVLTALRPYVVINTAAYHNVPMCEVEVEKAYRVNAYGALNVARACAEIQAWNIYISTDYVFDGTKRYPYVESDLPNPLNVYGTTKRAGEMHTLAYSEGRGIVLRVSGIYGRVPSRVKGTNFVYTMLRLARERDRLQVVADEITTPTWTYSIARQIAVLLANLTPGVFHCSAQGACSWYEFARAIFEITGQKVELEPVPASTFSSHPPVRRPAYSVLANAHFQRLGIDRMPHWREDLERFLKGLEL